MKICKISQALLALVVALSLASAGTPKSEFIEVSQDFSTSDRALLVDILDQIEAEMIWASIDRGAGSKLTIKVHNYYAEDHQSAPAQSTLSKLSIAIRSLVQNKYDVSKIEFQFLEEGQLSSNFKFCIVGC